MRASFLAIIQSNSVRDFLGALGETSWKSCPKIIYSLWCRPYSTGVILWSKYVSLDQLFRKTFIGLKSGIMRLKFIRSRVNYTWILRPVFQLWVLLSDFPEIENGFSLTFLLLPKIVHLFRALAYRHCLQMVENKSLQMAEHKKNQLTVMSWFDRLLIYILYLWPAEHGSPFSIILIYLLRSILLLSNFFIFFRWARVRLREEEREENDSRFARLKKKTWKKLV